MNAQLQAKADRTLRRERLYVIAGAAFALVMIVGLVLLVWQKTKQKVDISDYEGSIVDRWGQYSESLEGSRPGFVLLVEGEDGKRFTVKVDPDIYESARVGMRIKRSAGKIVLSDARPKESVGK